MRDEIDRLFETPLTELARTSQLLSGWTPAFDVYEDKDNFVVVAYHPVTIARDTIGEANALFGALDALPDQILFCYPNADAAFNEILSLPFYPSLTMGEVDRVCDAIARCCAARRRGKPTLWRHEVVA